MSCSWAFECSSNSKWPNLSLIWCCIGGRAYQSFAAENTLLKLEITLLRVTETNQPNKAMNQKTQKLS